LEVTSVSVPNPLVAGVGADLTCEHRPRMELYSVKWFKDGKEFYR